MVYYGSNMNDNYLQHSTGVWKDHKYYAKIQKNGKTYYVYKNGNQSETLSSGTLSNGTTYNRSTKKTGVMGNDGKLHVYTTNDTNYTKNANSTRRGLAGLASYDKTYKTSITGKGTDTYTTHYKGKIEQTTDKIKEAASSAASKVNSVAVSASKKVSEIANSKQVTSAINYLSNLLSSASKNVSNAVSTAANNISNSKEAKIVGNVVNNAKNSVANAVSSVGNSISKAAKSAQIKAWQTTDQLYRKTKSK